MVASLLVAWSAILAALPDEVLNVPNFNGSTCWKHFSGYLPVSGGKQLFYWYHEAVIEPEKKPLVLWLNGGPGCSSLGGMFVELGPFVVDKKLDVTLNPYSWNKLANVLFLEQPAGVGFSYPILPANDSTTAFNTYEAIKGFLSLHEELRGRPFYIMGESYAGHYVPNTAKAIQDGNALLPTPTRDYINLVGFAVGNGYTDWKLDFDANVPNGRYHALTSQKRLEAAAAACGGDFARCFWPRPGIDCPPECEDAVDAATIDATDGSIDIYDIYEDVCLEGKGRHKTQAFTLAEERRRAKESLASKRGRRMQTTISPIFPTCIDSYSADYLNLPAVQEAIHVDSSTVPGGKWSDCGNVDYDFNYESELPNYQKWVGDGKLQMLIYNGDADYILSHMGNAAWIQHGLNLNKSLEWTKWRGSDGQVAGFYEQYKTAGQPLTFLTVKGGGHMVPKDRPRHALDMLARFLAGGDYGSGTKIPDEPLCNKMQ